MRRMSLAAVLAALVFAAPAAARGVVVKAAYNKALKASILVDGRGLTLYIWTADIPKNTSVCAPDPGCTKYWQPLKAPATAGPGVKGSLLGTTTDGKIVTYHGHPLYFFKGGAASEPRTRSRGSSTDKGSTRSGSC